MITTPVRISVLRSLTFRPQPARAARFGVAAVLSGAVAMLVSMILVDAAQAGQWHDFNIFGLSTQLALMAVYLFVLGVCAALFVRRDRQAGYIAIVLWTASAAGLFSAISSLLVPQAMGLVAWVSWALNVVLLGSITWSFAHRGRFAALRGAVSAVVLQTAAMLAYAAFMPFEVIFYDSSYAEEDVDYAPPVDVEALYYAQADLLEEQFGALRPGDPDRVEMFGLVLGGTAHERVFAREVDSVAALIEQQYEASGRVVRLLNSESDPMRYPMANRQNLALSFETLAATMNPDDMAIVFLTSHGTPDRFSMQYWQAGTNDMTAQELASILDDSGLPNALVVVSSCYSGSFIDDLAAPDRMIVTAASESTASFGCSDANEWTWWGRAFVDEALRAERDPRKAFDMARSLVTAWERAEGYDPSLPQIEIGAQFDAILDAYLDQPLRQSALR